jgi:hypothetical protein
MARTAPENTDFATRKPPEIDMLMPNIGDRPDESIDGTDRVIKVESSDDAYYKSLMFDQDILTIFLHPGREKNAPQGVMVGVNEKAFMFKAGQVNYAKRCFVEGLARSQPMDVQTVSYKTGNDDSNGAVNTIVRNNQPGFFFQVLKDPNPAGAAWLESLMRTS